MARGRAGAAGAGYWDRMLRSSRIGSRASAPSPRPVWQYGACCVVAVFVVMMWAGGPSTPATEEPALGELAVGDAAAAFDDDLSIEDNTWREEAAARAAAFAAAHPRSVPRQIVATLTDLAPPDAEMEEVSAEDDVQGPGAWRLFGLHMAVPGKGRSLLVSWVTGRESALSYIEWGRDATKLSNVVRGGEGSLVELGSGEACGDVGHRVALHGVSTQSTGGIYYRVGDPVIDVWSEVRWLGADKNQGHVLVYGDGDNRVKTRRVMEAIGMDVEEKAARRNENYKLAVHVGDAGYARLLGGSDLAAQCEVLDTWFTYNEPVLAAMPFVMTPGNHDARQRSSKPQLHLDKCANLALERLPMMPYHAGTQGSSACPFPTDSEWWYTFTTGFERYVVLSTEHDLAPGSKQHDWMLKTLEEANAGGGAGRARHSFLIVVMHRPMYCSHHYGDCGAVAAELREWLEVPFRTFGVDLVLTGHLHAYERTKPVFDEQVTSFAPIHVTVGVGGAPQHEGGFQHAQPAWSAKRVDGDGFLRMRSMSHASIVVEYVEIEGADGTGPLSMRVADSFDVHSAVAARQAAAIRDREANGPPGAV
uniref:Acid phosphatase n=1 Tax=Bicosoecida sp. CB-2014 TaxID=1486930 RepID=A0A7S1GBY9_9STRA